MQPHGEHRTTEHRRLTRRAAVRQVGMGSAVIALTSVLQACGTDEPATEPDAGMTTGPIPTLAPFATPPSFEEIEPIATESPPPPPEAEETVSAEAATAPPEGDGAQVVEMNDQLRFEPEQLTIRVGDTVTWRTVGAIPHTSTCDEDKANQPEEHVQRPEGAEPWDSGLVNTGEEYSRTFEVAGEYTYFCIPHEAAGMIGYLTVGE